MAARIGKKATIGALEVACNGCGRSSVVIGEPSIHGSRILGVHPTPTVGTPPPQAFSDQ